MRVIQLDGSQWKTELDFIEALFDGLYEKTIFDVPGYRYPHGTSLDAFVDSMIWRGMGGIEPPYTVLVTNVSNAPQEVLNEIIAFVSGIQEARQWRLANQGEDIEVSIKCPELSR